MIIHKIVISQNSEIQIFVLEIGFQKWRFGFHPTISFKPRPNQKII